MTPMQTGIKIKINAEELENLKKIPGYLDYDSYPDFYLDIALPNEIGRFNIFRLFPGELT